MNLSMFARIVLICCVACWGLACDSKPAPQTGGTTPPPRLPVAAAANGTAPKDPNKTAAPTGATNAAATAPPQVAEPAFRLMPGQRTSFPAVARHLDAGGSFYLYVSPDQVLGWVDRGFDALGRVFKEKPFDLSDDNAATGQLVLRIVRAAFVQSGLRDIDGLGASTVDLGGGLTRNVQMLHRQAGPNAGLLWNLFGTQPHELGALNLMPGETAWAVHGDLDLAKAVAGVRAFVAAQAPPSAAKVVDEFWAKANQQVGIDKLLASYGGELGVYFTLDSNRTIELDSGLIGPLMSPVPLPPLEVPPVELRSKLEPDLPQGAPPKQAPPAKSVPQAQPAPGISEPVRSVRAPGGADAKKIRIPEPGLVITLKVRDNALMEFITAQVASLKVPVKEVTVEGVKLSVHSVPAEGLPLPLSPTLYQSQGYLVLASTEALARKVLAVQQGKDKGLRGTAEFQRLTRGLELRGNQFSFLSQRFGDEYARLVRAGMEGTEDLPPFMREWLVKFMTLGMDSTVGVMQATPEGWFAATHTTGMRQESALLAAGAVLPAAVMAGLLLPALSSAREAAVRTQSLNQAKQLGVALIQVAFDNGNKVPVAKEWCDVLLKPLGNEGAFHSPRFGGRATTQGKGSDYALNAALGGADINKVDVHTVLLFECSLGWNGAGGLKEAREHMTNMGVGQIAVVFVDGSARACRVDELDLLRWKP